MNKTKSQINLLLNHAFSKNEAKKRYEKKRKRILLTLNNQELKEIKKISLKARKKPSVFVKELILTQIKEENFLSEEVEKRLSEACLLVRRIGNNINQISKKINTEQKAEKEDFTQALSFIQKLENEIIFTITKS